MILLCSVSWSVCCCCCGGGCGCCCYFAERTQSAQSQRDSTKPHSTTSTTSATASASSVPRPARVASATTTRPPLFVPSIHSVATAAAPSVPVGYATTSIKARGGPGTGYAAAPTAAVAPTLLAAPNASPTPAPPPTGPDALWSPNPSATLHFVSPPPPASVVHSEQDAPLPTQRQLDVKSDRRATAQVCVSVRWHSVFVHGAVCFK